MKRFETEAEKREASGNLISYSTIDLWLPYYPSYP